MWPVHGGGLSHLAIQAGHLRAPASLCARLPCTTAPCSLTGLLASCPNVRTAEHLIFVEHCR